MYGNHIVSSKHYFQALQIKRQKNSIAVIVIVNKEADHLTNLKYLWFASSKFTSVWCAFERIEKRTMQKKLAKINHGKH